MNTPFASTLPRPALPGTYKAAILRGLLGKCPRCGEAKLFAKYLKPDPCCPACGQDWTRHQADDFPPYIAIFITGHLMAPVVIELGSNDALPLWGRLLLGLLIASTVMFSLLQPAKGAIIALQWWLGMHRFDPAGRDEAALARGEPAPL
ncbi:MAG: hypothetical protein RLZZ84_1072 [Pseudomonadota bacterium]|jgi:uncharacterized protein (DUF983 family)